MKKTLKILLLCVILVVFIGNIKPLMATTISEKNYGEISEQGYKFEKVKIDEINQTIVQDDTINSKISMIFGVVAYICYGIAFAVLLVKGVKFMAAAPEGKAEIKKEMIAIVVGAFIVFAIHQIVQIIANISGKLF